MKLTFLWDEEKTRQLFKFALICFILACSAAVVYTIIWPDLPNSNFLSMIATSYGIWCLINLWIINKGNPGLRYLVSALVAQVHIAMFMALSGGFLSIAQFTSFGLLLMVTFQLGAASSFILGGFSIITFIGILIWTSLFEVQPHAAANFFFYTVIYLVLLALQWRSGQELSIQLEAKKKLEEVDDLKNQFIILTSHYLRTPLAAIKSSISTIKSVQSNNDRFEKLQHIESSTKELELILEKFLAISSIEKGETKILPSSSDINLLLSELIADFQPLALERKIMLLYKSPDNIEKLPLDRVRLKQAIASLLDNAIKYNHEGGSVIVSLKREDKLVVIQVVDTGEGIDKEKQQNLFTTFNRGGVEKILSTEREGLGLSLYLSKLIIEAHGGKISVMSEEGKGSTFTVTLPLIKTKP